MNTTTVVDPVTSYYGSCSYQIPFDTIAAANGANNSYCDISRQCLYYDYQCHGNTSESSYTLTYFTSASTTTSKTFQGQNNASCLNAGFVSLRLDCSGVFQQPYVPTASVIVNPSVETDCDGAPPSTTQITAYYEQDNCIAAPLASSSGYYFTYLLDCNSTTAASDWTMRLYPYTITENPCVKTPTATYHGSGTTCTAPSADGLSFRVDCSGNAFVTNSPSSSNSNGISTTTIAIIIGSVVGGVAVLAVVIAVVYYFVFANVNVAKGAGESTTLMKGVVSSA